MLITILSANKEMQTIHTGNGKTENYSLSVTYEAEVVLEDCRIRGNFTFLEKEMEDEAITKARIAALFIEMEDSSCESCAYNPQEKLDQLTCGCCLGHSRWIRKMKEED